MDPLAQCCHDPDCTARGKLGLGNIRVHSRKEKRYRCTTCGQTFAATRDTLFYRLKKSLDLVTIVITLLCHGCPVQAIVVAFGLDERTVADWRDRAGRRARVRDRPTPRAVDEATRETIREAVADALAGRRPRW